MGWDSVLGPPMAVAAVVSPPQAGSTSLATPPVAAAARGELEKRVSGSAAPVVVAPLATCALLFCPYVWPPLVAVAPRGPVWGSVVSCVSLSRPDRSLSHHFWPICAFLYCSVLSA
eukprot:2692717-Pyramimonas_sp.AAC.1